LKIEDLTRVKVYSASRHLEDVQQAPAAVTIVTRDEIQRYGWRDLDDVLRSLRGFYTSYDRLYSYLGVRGFLRPGDYNSRILVLLNGHRMNENVYDSAPMELPLDLDLIDHIEVVRGPGSSLFGTNAVFGVVNIITRRPAADSAIEVSGTASSFTARNGRVTAIDYRGKMSVLVSGDMSLDPGQSRLFFPEFAAPETNNGFAENMDGTHSDNVFGDLQYGDFRLQGLYGDRRKKFPTASYGSIFNDPADQTEDQRAYLDGSFHRNLSARTGLDVRAFYDEYGSNGTIAFLDLNGNRAIGIGEARADWMGGEVNLQQQIGKHSLTFGADYEYSLDIRQRNHQRGQTADLFYSNKTSWLTAGYVEAELHFIPRLTINAGGRLDWFNTFGAALSPRLAFVYSPSSKTSLKYILGKAFRAPNAYEEYYFDNLAIEPPPHKLEPETILSHEIVVEHALRPWLSASAGAYYTQLKRLIDQVPDAGTGLSYFVNDGRVHSKGLEFELDANHKSGVLGRASYEISKTYDDQLNAPLDNSPRDQAKLNLSFPLFRRAFAGVEVLYTGAMQDYRGTRVSPFALTNATLSSRKLWGGWQFSASCYNALDRRWFSPMGPNDPEAMIQEDGRTYRFKVSYHLSFRDVPVQK